MVSMRRSAGFTPSLVGRWAAAWSPLEGPAACRSSGLSPHGPLPSGGPRLCRREYHPTPSPCKVKWRPPPRPAGPPSPATSARKQTSPSSPLPRSQKQASPSKSPPPPPPPPTGSPTQGPKAGNDDKKEPLSELFQRYRFPFVGSIIAGGLLTGYISYLAVVVLKSQPCADHDHGHIESEAPTGLPPDITRATVGEFDAGLDVPERLMGVTRLRKRLARRCRGHVLEVAVGTGRNIAYYDWDDIADVSPELRTVRRAEKRRYVAAALPPGGEGEGEGDVEMASFTGVDVSADALEFARSRIRTLVPGLKARIRRARSAEDERAGQEQFDRAGAEEVLSLQDGRLRLIRADAEKALPLPPQDLPPRPSPLGTTTPVPAKPPQHYDVVIQNFGLCSVSDPSSLLANMASVVRPGTGRILLLEHGRGTWGFVNNLLDKFAASHFVRFGCWWNRDVEGIVRDAAAAVPGLEVVSIERPGLLQGGTTLLIQLKVDGSKTREGNVTDVNVKSVKSDVQKPTQKRA